MHKSIHNIFLINKVLKKMKKSHLQFHLFDLHLLEGQQDLEFLDPLENLAGLQGQVHHDHPAKHNLNIIYLKRTGLDQSNRTLALLIYFLAITIYKDVPSVGTQV